MILEIPMLSVHKKKKDTAFDVHCQDVEEERRTEGEIVLTSLRMSLHMLCTKSKDPYVLVLMLYIENFPGK